MLPSSQQEPLAYGPGEAARLLGVSRSRLYQLIDAGQLESVTLGRRRLIRHRDLEGLLDRLADGGSVS